MSENLWKLILLCVLIEKDLRKLYLICASFFIVGYEFSQDSITGCYSSNFAVVGWFGTHLRLNQDSTFDYLFAGDLFYDKAHGTYLREKNTVVLMFNKPLNDSLKLRLKDSLGIISEYVVARPTNISEKFRPSKLRYCSGKLFLYDKVGRRIRKKMNSEEKKRAYYLLRHPNHADDDW